MFINLGKLRNNSHPHSRGGVGIQFYTNWATVLTVATVWYAFLFFQGYRGKRGFRGRQGPKGKPVSTIEKNVANVCG